MFNVVRASAAALLLGAFVAPSLSAAAAEGPDFKAKVWPIIDASCTGCHGEKKQKGKLRLDTKKGWLKGGGDGKIVEKGHPEKSNVMEAIKWESKDEDKNMPPKKDKKLSAEQVKIIEEWIKAGMPWPK
ncbi:MAG TPA: c-type cytochrome domain-containing protein [Planctomycetota bacterium]|nr:c-type cytochrome domain-containing protein [Planctomycetota bacterium]